MVLGLGQSKSLSCSFETNRTIGTVASALLGIILLVCGVVALWVGTASWYGCGEETGAGVGIKPDSGNIRGSHIVYI